MRHIALDHVREYWLKHMGRLPKFSDGDYVTCEFGIGEIEELENLPHPFVHEYRYGVRIIQPCDESRRNSIYYFFENELELI